MKTNRGGVDMFPHETKERIFNMEEKENKAMCPLFLAASQAAYGIHCKKGNCAWYDKDEDKCALLLIAHNLKGVSSELYDISYNLQ